MEQQLACVLLKLLKCDLGRNINQWRWERWWYQAEYEMLIIPLEWKQIAVMAVVDLLDDEWLFTHIVLKARLEVDCHVKTSSVCNISLHKTITYRSDNKLPYQVQSFKFSVFLYTYANMLISNSIVFRKRPEWEWYFLISMRNCHGLNCYPISYKQRAETTQK